MTRFAANLSMLWTDRPPLDRFAAAASAGFTHVEMLFPQDLPGRELEEVLAAHRLAMTLFDFNAGSWSTGERGIAADPSRVSEFRSLWNRDLDLADRLGTRTMTVLAGVRPETADSRSYDETLCANLSDLADLAAPLGITVTVEAINGHDVPGFHVRTVAHAASIVRQVGRDNVAVQFDQYHVCREAEDPLSLIAEHVDIVGHVQIADAPGRHEPGTGVAPISEFLELLDRLNYTGNVGLEYSPTRDTDDSLDWLPRHLRGA